MALLADGLRYAEVAACMSISTRQVQRHVAEAVARLGVSNGTQLVAVAVAENLVRRSGRFPAGMDPVMLTTTIARAREEVFEYLVDIASDADIANHAVVTTASSTGS